MERIHKKTILIIIGILLLLGISCVNSCSKEKQQNAKTGVYPAEGTIDIRRRQLSLKEKATITKGIEKASLYRMTRVIHIDDGSEPYR